MHQNQWMEDIKELEEKPGVTVPSSVPREWDATDFSYDLMNFFEGKESKKGRLGFRETPDGNGEFGYAEKARIFW